MRRLALVLAAVLAAAPLCASAQGVPQLYQASYELESAKQYDAALGVLEKMPEAEQETYAFRLRLGWLSYLAGRHGPAVEAYRAAVRLAPDAVEPRLGLMLPLMALRRWQDTEKVAQEVLRRDPGSYLAQSRLAWALYNLGRYAEAEARYRKVVAAYPADVDMRSGLGWSLLKQGKRAEAAAAFKAALHLSPRLASALEGSAAAR